MPVFQQFRKWEENERMVKSKGVRVKQICGPSKERTNFRGKIEMVEWWVATGGGDKVVEYK